MQVLLAFFVRVRSTSLRGLWLTTNSARSPTASARRCRDHRAVIGGSSRRKFGETSEDIASHLCYFRKRNCVCTRSFDDKTPMILTGSRRSLLVQLVVGDDGLDAYKERTTTACYPIAVSYHRRTVQLAVRLLTGIETRTTITTSLQYLPSKRSPREKGIAPKRLSDLVRNTWVFRRHTPRQSTKRDSG